MKKGLIVLGGGILLIGALLYWLVATTPPIENQRGVIVGDGPVLAAIDRETFGQLGRVSVAQLGAWQTEGKVFLVAPGTPVLVIAVQVPRSQVRVLGGPYQGKELHVQTTAIGRP